jgi:hypothetical protein
MLQVFDLSAANPFRNRVATTGRFVPRNQVLTGLDELLFSTVTYLDEMSRSPRRTPPIPPPAGPPPR